MWNLRLLANVDKPNSFSNRMRDKRFLHFESLVERKRKLESLAERKIKPLRIVDIGGTIDFWEQRKWAGREDVSISLVNLVRQEPRHANMECLIGDATNLTEIADKSFDVSFSNSVIEHLFTYDNQRAMAREMCRIAPSVWLQTPNYWFPVEPHFHFVGWQWLPIKVRAELLLRRDYGWRKKAADLKQAYQLVAEVRLMTRSELERIFPGAEILGERFGPLVKSWILFSGF
jgi:hypothetical protein